MPVDSIILIISKHASLERPGCIESATPVLWAALAAAKIAFFSKLVMGQEQPISPIMPALMDVPSSPEFTSLIKRSVNASVSM